MNLTWPEWLEVVAQIGTIWPQTKTTTLAKDAAGDYVEMDTLRAWHGLVKDHPQDVVYGAVFRYATTDPKNEWPPNGSTIARMAREISAENYAEAKRRALPPPGRDDGPIVDARTFSQRHGFADFKAYRKDRCKSQRHYGQGDDDTCRACNDLPPMSAVLEQAANG